MNEKHDGLSFSILDWNIQVGTDSGLLSNDWLKRKLILSKLIQAHEADIICVQEALHEQLLFLASALPKHRWTGAGRDDGKLKGEHCAIFYNSKFTRLRSGTFG